MTPPTRPTTVPCAWCDVPVHTPQPGWQPGQAAFCVQHRVIEGRLPYTVGQIALADAVDLQDTPADALLRWPWEAVHELAGVLVPRRIYYVAGFAGNGKTSFLAACYAAWLAQGMRVSYLPLESDALETMTRVACAHVGISADEALSLRLRLRADDGEALARAQLAALHDAFTALRQDPAFFEAFRVDPTPTLTPKTFARVLATCRALDSDVLIVDHVDHAEADVDDRSPEIAVSNQIQRMALHGARELNIPIVLATQLNSRAAGGDPLAHYLPPRMDYLWNKGAKEHIAAVCLGLYRPIDPTREEALALVRRGLAEPRTVLKPDTMAVCGMKLRFGGSRKGESVELAYHAGRLTDRASPDMRATVAATHGIPTVPTGLFYP